MTCRSTTAADNRCHTMKHCHVKAEPAGDWNFHEGAADGFYIDDLGSKAARAGMQTSYNKVGEFKQPSQVDRAGR
jgi:hypothetical protein